ncbi:MAG: hypothetical protein KAT37_01455 [Candidatus Aenigmarchaeota archaeon]|nr:hypothetical protein [Candidatus Aenigmarchaeota archaeon]
MIIDSTKNFYKNYVLNNGGLHLFRFVNTNFGSKWAGLWSFDKKLLDYWAYRVNDVWLSMQNCFEFEHKFWCANHKHRIENLLVTEEVVPLKDKIISILKVKNTTQSKIKVNILLEVGVNIRYRDTNFHNYKYTTKTKRSFVEVKNNIGNLYFGSLDGKFVKSDRYEQHEPGKYADYCGYVVKQGLTGSWNESMQNKYLPGEYVIKVNLEPGEEKEIPFFFSEGKITGHRKYRDSVENSKKAYERLRGQYKNTEYSAHLDKIVSSLMTFEVEKGFVAGYPFFNEIWIRDACWCLPAYLYLGMFSHVKKFLKTVERKIKGGKVPSLMNSKRCFYNSSDVAPLWIIGLYDYLDFTGDKKLGKSMGKKVREVLDYGKLRLQKNLITSTGFTWMDTLERKKAIDLQSLWCRAFYCGGMILYMNSGETNEYFQISSKILGEIDKNYWNSVPKDNLGGNFKSPNFIFQLAMMHISRDVSKQLSLIMSKDYLTPVGVRTRPVSDLTYDPKGYHTGSVWPFISLVTALAQCNYEKTENVKRLIDINMANFDKRCINGINEFFDADDLKPKGCTSQAWSVAGMLTVLDSYVLGIKPKLTEKMIIFDPSKFNFKRFERKIKIGKSKVSVNYSRKGNIMELEIKNLPVKAKIPNVYSKCIVNGKETKESVVTLQAKKSYSLILKF